VTSYKGLGRMTKGIFLRVMAASQAKGQHWGKAYYGTGPSQVGLKS